MRQLRSESRFNFRIVIVCLVALFVSACVTSGSTGKRREVVKLPPAELPVYQPGDSFVYVDGDNQTRERRVVSVEGENVNWITETGFRFEAYRNFVVPRLSWDGSSSSGEMLNTPSPNQLWPLEPKRKIELTADYRRVRKDSKDVREYEEFWKCKVRDARPVAVPAGTFDAYKVVCKRYDDTRRNVTRTHIWYYAPQVGHFVKRVKKYSGKPKQVIELVEYRRSGVSG